MLDFVNLVLGMCMDNFVHIIFVVQLRSVSCINPSCAYLRDAQDLDKKMQHLA